MAKQRKQSENIKFLRSALHDSGLLIHAPAVMSIPVIIISLVAKEMSAIVPFLSMALVSLVVGQALIRIPSDGKSTRQHPLSMVVVAFSWLMVVLIGTIPFWGIALADGTSNPPVAIFSQFSNAFFESMSGFTSTGLSVVPDPGRLPACLQFWRSLMEWVGGAGVVLLALLMIKPGENAKKLYVAEARTTLFENSMKQTVKWIWIIYGAYTVFAVFLFWFSGMPLWESLNHGLTAISTGGFSVTSGSFSHYPALIKIATIFIIILGALSFHSHYFFWVKKDRTFPFRQSQIKTFFGCWTAGILFFSLIKLTFVQTSTVIDYLFQWTSALSTCGFSTVVLSSAPEAFLLLLIFGMFIGGCAGSTTGGIKTDRFIWALKAFVWRIKSVWKPETHNAGFYFDQKKVSQKQGLLNVASARSLILLWMAAIILSSFVLLLILGDQFPFLHILFEASSALGSVGLSTGVVSASLPGSAKYIFCLLMWMGRLEIIAVIILFSTPNFYLENSKTAK